MAFENQIGKIVKISYFSYRNDEKIERYIIGKLLLEDADFLQIQGLKDGTIFAINKEHIISVIKEGENND